MPGKAGNPAAYIRFLQEINCRNTYKIFFTCCNRLPDLVYLACFQLFISAYRRTASTLAINFLQPDR
jgi:hypothetical protein